MKSLKILSSGILNLFLQISAYPFTPSGLLEIHTINVQQGASVLVIGPDGTTLLMDGGNNGKGVEEIVPYLESIGLSPEDGLDYMLASHLNADHCGGLDEVIEAGYDVQKRIYDNGSDYWTETVEDFKVSSFWTKAGSPEKISLGEVIPLGECATATCVVVDGEVLGFGKVPNALKDENDRSAGILIEYHYFNYLFAGDLGGGSDDSLCTNRFTQQVNLETPLAFSLLTPGGADLLDSHGVEVLHVNHHGSESSMNSDFMNLLTPQVTLISVGKGQSSNLNHPRKSVVENVLFAREWCITADSALVLQTEEGSPTGTETSYGGYCVGDIRIRTDGLMTYRLEATGEVSQGPVEIEEALLPRDFSIEEYNRLIPLPDIPGSVLYQNSPNPFTFFTNIRFENPGKGPLSLKIYDTMGRVVRTLMDEMGEEGIYWIIWDGKDEEGKEVPAGVYLYQMKGREIEESKKIIRLR